MVQRRMSRWRRDDASVVCHRTAVPERGGFDIRRVGSSQRVCQRRSLVRHRSRFQRGCLGLGLLRNDLHAIERAARRVWRNQRGEVVMREFEGRRQMAGLNVLGGRQRGRGRKKSCGLLTRRVSGGVVDGSQRPCDRLRLLLAGLPGGG